MTLTVPDVKNWKVDALRIQSDVEALGDKLVAKWNDAASRQNTLAEAWHGVAATAAAGKIVQEQTAASAVAAKFDTLAKAFELAAGPLHDAQTRVVNLCDEITSKDRFTIADDAVVSADNLIASLGDKANEIDKVNLRAAAAARTWDLTMALKAAEAAAEAAKATVSAAAQGLQSDLDPGGQPQHTSPASVAGANAAPAPHAGATPVAAGGSGSGGPSHNVWSGSSGGTSTGHSGSGGGGGGALGPSGGPPSGAMPTGEKAEWIRQAMEVLKSMGYDTSQMDPRDIEAIIDHESGGDPHAINLWDSNYEAGHPSKGLMQTIDGTFDSYKAPGHEDIWNPVDNIVAGVRYSVDRYGSVSDVPGIEGLRSGSGYVGY